MCVSSQPRHARHPHTKPPIILTVNTPATVGYYLHGLICHIGYGVAGQPPELPTALRTRNPRPPQEPASAPWAPVSAAVGVTEPESGKVIAAEITHIGTWLRNRTCARPVHGALATAGKHDFGSVGHGVNQPPWGT